MTISSSTRKAGPFTGNGATATYSFTFKIFQASDLLVVRTSLAGVETTLTLTTDYTVSLNADQNSSPGGSVTLVAGNLATGLLLTMTSQVPYTQTTDLTNQGGFYPQVITNSLDKLTIQTQQLQEQVNRSAKLPISSAAGVDSLVADITLLADNITDLNTLIANLGDVNDVADNMADVNTVADNIADVHNFASVYLGAKANDPTLRNDGSALQAGDLYFNTTNNEMRVYEGTLWQSGFAGTLSVQRFSGDGSDTTFTLSSAPAGENNTQIYISGVYQQKDTYSLSGTTITFSIAPPSGTDNIEVVTISTLAVGETDAALVSYQPAGTGAVERNVQNKLRDVVSVKDYGALGNGVNNDTSAFQSAIDAVNAAGGGTVVVPAGNYRIESTINMKSNVTVTCATGAVIDGENDPSGDLVAFTGTLGSEFDFSATRTRGDTTVALSGSPGFVAGDIVHFVSYTSVFAAGTYNLGYHVSDNCYYSEWNIIVENLGGGVYRLAIPFEFPGWTTSAKAKKVTSCQNAHWVGGSVRRTTSGGAGDSIFAGAWAYMCSVQDVETFRGSRPGWTVEWMESWKCEARNVTNHNDPTYKYSYFVDHASLNRFKTVGSQDCGFVGLKESFGGQSVDFTYSSSQAPYSNIRSYCRDGFFHRSFEGLTSHQGCYQEQWIGNTITDCYDDGMVVRGYMPTVQGNIITSTVDVTDDLVFTAGTFVIGRQYKILTVGTTNFTLIGAASNTVGVNFVATGVGAGTGTATQADTYGVRLGYGGSRRADISNNVIRGFYGAVGIYGSPSLGEWTNVLCNVHDNEIANCFVGFTTSGIGESNDFRFITYQNNRHSAMGRWIALLPEYVAGCTIKGNVCDGGFRYDGGDSYVAFVEAAANCPALTITGNVWSRTKSSNSGKGKYFAFVAAIDDTTTFPEADWAAQTTVYNNYATFDTDASFVYYSVSKGSTYYQNATLLPPTYASTIASGVAQAIPTPHRVFYVNVETESLAATDDLDQLVPYTNCWFAEGDVVYLRTVSNARDVTIRDIATSGASSNGFQTPLNASVTLGSGNDIVTCVYTGTHWAVAAQSLNG